MSDRYPLAELDDLPDDLRERILAEQEKAGFVPEVFLMFGRRPAESRAFFAYHDALMEREGNLSKADKEMIVVTVSGQNNCLFCVVAHGAILRIVKKDPYISDQLAVSYHKADLTPRERAICNSPPRSICARTSSTRTLTPSTSTAWTPRTPGHRRHHRPVRSQQPSRQRLGHAPESRVYLMGRVPRQSDPPRGRAGHRLGRPGLTLLVDDTARDAATAVAGARVSSARRGVALMFQRVSDYWMS